MRGLCAGGLLLALVTAPDLPAQQPAGLPALKEEALTEVDKLHTLAQ
jgi:hypothetical protein